VHQDVYPAVCQERRWKPLVYSQFLNVVSALQSYDLVTSILERRRMGGYVRHVEVRFDPGAALRVAQARLGL
jgi:hypothetical protein